MAPFCRRGQGHGALAFLGLKHSHLTHIRRATRSVSAGHAASTLPGSRRCFIFPVNPNKVGHLVTFLTTSPPLARALAERNYDQPTPVQTAVLADTAVDRDLLAS